MQSGGGVKLLKNDKYFLWGKKIVLPLHIVKQQKISLYEK